MGGTESCSEGCYTWMKGYNDTTSQLRKIYRDKYKQSIFYRTCIQSIELENNLYDEDSLQNLKAKNSLIESTHYESERLIMGNENNTLPNRFSGLSQSEKKVIVVELVKKSFMLLDMSDIFDEERERKIYESQVKREIFQNDESFMSSFVEMFDENLMNSLRKFEPETIMQLENYVTVCEKIKSYCSFGEHQQYMNEEQPFLTKLLLRLKADVIFTYNRRVAKEQEQGHQNRDDRHALDELIKNIRTMLSLFSDTVLIICELRLASNFGSSISSSSKKSQSSHNKGNEKNVAEDLERNTEKSVTDRSQNSQFKGKYNQVFSFNFLNEVNFDTLITSIVFSDENFHQFFIQAIKKSLKNQVREYTEKNKTPDRDIYRMLQNGSMLSSKKGYLIKSNLTNLFNPTQTLEQPFKKTIKLFNKITTKFEPILKLKILGELEKQFIQEYQEVVEKQKLPELLFDRNISQILARWLLNRRKEENIGNVISLVMAYCFIHHEYRIGPKGSILVSFVEEVENILGWSIMV